MTMKRASRFLLSLVVLIFLAIHGYAGKTSSTIQFVSISPDGSQLAAVVRTGDRASIYLVSANSGRGQRLTKADNGDELTPSFSSDGKQIVFVWLPTNANNSQIRIVNLDGSDLLRWPVTEGSPSTPRFTPDGKKIVFRSSSWFGHYSPIAAPHAHEWDYFIANVDGSSVLQLTHSRFYEVSPPSVSPDGKSMLAVTEDSHVGEYFVTYALEEGKLLSSFRPHLPQKEDNDGPILDNPVFLSDGKKFLFMAASEGRGFNYDYDVYVGELGSTSVEKLTSKNGYAASLTVSADGKKAAYLKTQFDLLGKPKETKIYLMDVTSRTATPLEVNLSP